MSQIILLDAGPLGLASNPRFSPQTSACNQWILDRLHNGAQVLVSEIADYEVRRELLRANKQRGIARLDTTINFLGLLPVNRAVCFAQRNSGHKHGRWENQLQATNPWMQM